MSDYIKRKDVLALIDDFELTLPDDEIFFSYIPVKAVEELPSADVVERKHGKWIDGVCSICNEGTDIVESRYFNYCPYCGAKMEFIEVDGDDDGR